MTDGASSPGIPGELKRRIAGHRLDLTFVNAMMQSAVRLLDGQVLRTDPMQMSARASEPRHG